MALATTALGGTGSAGGLTGGRTAAGTFPVGRVPRPAKASRNALGFGLFLLVNAVLFVRPAELWPDLMGEWPLYEILICACLLVSFPVVLAQLTGSSLASRPVSACVLGVVAAAVFAGVSRGSSEDVITAATVFGKIFLYYLLLVGLVDSPARLRLLLLCVGVLILAHTVAGVLNYHGVIEIPGVHTMEDYYFDKETGLATSIPRLRTTGLYEGPNSFAQLIAVSMLVCIYGLTDPRFGMFRPLWLAPFGFLGYALSLTKSRGGLITLMAGLLILFFTRFRARFGVVKTSILAAAVVPVLLVVFGGRMTEISTKTDTASERMDLWGEAYSDLRHTPLGLGINEFDKKMGLVVHNSFLHAFVESGVFGGMLFIGGFVAALWGCARLGSQGVQTLDPEMRRLRPFVMAVVGAYAAGLLSLSRCYAEPTYTVFGIGAACMAVTQAQTGLPPLRFDRRLLTRVAIVSALYLVAGLVLCRAR